jgi:uncharacterized protein with ParB-like and HNH nuclease domain
MEAHEAKVEDFLSSYNTQFVIPIYQRNYDWSEGHCKELLDDILEVGTNKERNAHFIGSIVYIHDSLYTPEPKIKEFTIIDGQQRLATITLIYLVIRRLAKKLNNEFLVNKIIEAYLINKHDEFASEEEKLKLRQTDNNDKALKYLLRNDENEEYSDDSKLIINFNYLKRRITKENYQVVLTGLSKLRYVNIALERGRDEPQKIFESLNSTGLALSQADLIRNYILMGLDRTDQNKIYQNYWELIENLAKDETRNVSRVSDFIRDYLTLENRKIPNKGKVNSEFKAKYPISTLDVLEANLSSIKSLAKHYNKLINPRKEPDKEIRLQLEYINRLEINVAYPFLMKVYDDYTRAVIGKSIFLKVLDLIQSFVLRRFILGLPTNALNKIFMSLYDKVDKNNYLFSIQKSLLQRSGVQRFPKNAEFEDALKIKDVYNIKSRNRTYLLEKLENYENREPVRIEGNEDITTEHIFPQKPEPKWEIDLGNDEYVFIKENYLNTIGNLTLSGNNGKLGSKSFVDKRDMNVDGKEQGYKFSKLWLNRYLASLPKWNKLEIEKRFELIAERCLKIWTFPEIELQGETERDEVNIFNAEDPKYKKLEYAIFLDQKREIREVAKLYVEVFKELFESQPETFFTTELGDMIGLTKHPVEGKPRQAVPINDTYFIEGNLDNMSKFDRIKQALTIFDYEDELTIKYAD